MPTRLRLRRRIFPRCRSSDARGLLLMMMRTRRLLSVTCSLAFALQCFAVGTSSAATTFEVGAQWTDMTPEPFDAAAIQKHLDHLCTNLRREHRPQRRDDRL